MKKLTILAGIAVMALAACTKSTPVAEPQKEITFQVANYVQTKANVVYDTANEFGTYAWFTAVDNDPTDAVTYSDHAEFMVNEKVGFVSSVWRTKVQTFYWPKTGTMDFISYSPFDGTNGTADSNPVVTKSAAHAYTLDYTASAAASTAIAATDYMYADKVTCTNADQNTPNDVNIDKEADGTTDYTGAQYSGVPTLFRHALAKLNFTVEPTFLSYTDPLDATKTTYWKVTVKELSVSGFYTEGTCQLNWGLPTAASTAEEWIKPANNVWTVAAGSASTTAQNLVGDTPIVYQNKVATDPGYFVPGTTAATNLNALTQAFVMPQLIVDGQQQLKLDIDIETTLVNGNVIKENYTKTLDLYDMLYDATASPTPRIEMNKNLTYKIRIKPTAYNNTTDAPTDVIINFDPAVADWESESVALNIIL